MKLAMIGCLVALTGCVTDVYVPPGTDSGQGNEKDSPTMSDKDSGMNNLDGMVSQDSMSNSDAGQTGTDSGPMVGWCGVNQGGGQYAKAYCPSFDWTDGNGNHHSCTEPCPSGYVCHVDPGNKNIVGVCQP